jgi:hypothetical protein
MTNNTPELTTEQIVAATRTWLERAVIGLNLCPFAKAVQVRNQIRYAVSRAAESAALRAELADELQRLAAADPALHDTTLLIHPWVLADFFDYNEFLKTADEVVEELGLTGEIQIASFHPHYQFADSAAGDIENFTNRSPFPMLHLLRESSVERAVASFPDTDRIYQNNMETLRRLGHEGWRRLFDPLEKER